jgi:hypothetical protein
MSSRSRRGVLLDGTISRSARAMGAESDGPGAQMLRDDGQSVQPMRVIEMLARKPFAIPRGPHDPPGTGEAVTTGRAGIDRKGNALHAPSALRKLAGKARETRPEQGGGTLPS